jgi:hypothetical protein
MEDRSVLTKIKCTVRFDLVNGDEATDHWLVLVDDG